MSTVAHIAATAPQLVALVDVDDLEDGDLDARIAEIHMPAALEPHRTVPASPAAQRSGADAVVAAWSVVRDRRTAVHAHRLGARAAGLLA